MSVSTLTSSGYGGSMCGCECSLRRRFRITKERRIGFGSDREYVELSFCGQSKIRSSRDLKVAAGWLFKGDDQRVDANCERSDSANEDLLMFFFQLDLATRVQYALNVDQFEIAQELRNKLTECLHCTLGSMRKQPPCYHRSKAAYYSTPTPLRRKPLERLGHVDVDYFYAKVEEEILKLQQARRGSGAKSEAQDMAIGLLRLRADLQNAIQSENYGVAAQLRDEISKLEAESLAASVKAQAYENAQYGYRLGQKVRHKIFGYQAVICGMDPVCCESRSWMENANVGKLTRGPDQPFYQVLVDRHADPNLLVAYVAEENLLAPEQPEKDRFDHPYVSFLFYGMDAAGDFIPVKQLREKYNRPRHEVPYDSDNDNSGKDT